jgi:hypothetical protein
VEKHKLAKKMAGLAKWTDKDGQWRKHEQEYMAETERMEKEAASGGGDSGASGDNGPGGAGALSVTHRLANRRPERLCERAMIFFAAGRCGRTGLTGLSNLKGYASFSSFVYIRGLRQKRRSTLDSVRVHSFRRRLSILGLQLAR